MPSTAPERARRWLDDDLADRGLSGSGASWLIGWYYDACDLLCAGTATCAWWPAGVLGAPRSLQILQLGLVVCEAAMIRGSPR